MKDFFKNDPNYHLVSKGYFWTCMRPENYIELIQEYIDIYGINIKCMHGMTPLMRAVISKDIEIVTFLINKGADATIRCENYKKNCYDYANEIYDPYIKNKIIEILK